MTFKKTVANIEPYEPELPLQVLQAQLGLDRVVRMSANENTYGTSNDVQKAVRNWDFSQARDYPDGDANDLRTAVASKIGVNPDQLLFGCGLDEVIELISRTFIEAGDEVVEPWPTFSEYKLHAQIDGATVVDVPVKDNGQFDLDGLVAAVTPQTKLMWICNPNNPTGTFIDPAALGTFLARVPEHVLILVDEAYIDFVTATATPSALQFLDQCDHMLVLRTFSKAYGLANFRVGYAVVPRPLIGRMQAVRLPYNLSGVAQLAARAALADQSFVDRTRERVAAARSDWTAFMRRQGLRYYESQTNFLFFAAPNAAALKDKLLQKGYLVRSGLRPDWLRITFGSEADNAAVQTVIEEFYKSEVN